MEDGSNATYGEYPTGGYGTTTYSDYGTSAGVLPRASPGLMRRPSNFHAISLSLLVFLPVLTFLLISLGWVFLYQQKPILFWSMTCACVGLSLLFMLVPPVRDGPRYWFNLGCLCLVAAVSANGVGLWNFKQHLETYWAHEGQQVYNVLPGDRALSHSDAGRLIFSGDAHVDVSASIGLQKGHRYCVAPIISATSPVQQIQYWAAGVDCCGRDSGSFSCGEVKDLKAHAGLVYLDHGLGHEALRYFKEAAREAGAAHGAEPSEDALFVEWTVDPDEAMRRYWSAGVLVLVASACAHAVVSSIAGLLVHFGCRRRAASRGKVDKRSL